MKIARPGILTLLTLASLAHAAQAAPARKRKKTSPPPPAATGARDVNVDPNACQEGTSESAKLSRFQSTAQSIVKPVITRLQLDPKSIPEAYRAVLQEWYVKVASDGVASNQNIVSGDQDALNRQNDPEKAASLRRSMADHARYPGWSMAAERSAEALSIPMGNWNVNKETPGLLGYSEIKVYPDGHSMMGFEFALNAKTKRIEVYPAWVDDDGKEIARGSLKPMVTFAASAAHPGFFAAAERGRRAYVPAAKLKTLENAALDPDVVAANPEMVSSISGNGHDSAVIVFRRFTSLPYALTSILDLACLDATARRRELSDAAPSDDSGSH